MYIDLKDGVIQSLIDRVFTPVNDMRIENGALSLTHTDGLTETIQLSDFTDLAKYKKGLLAAEVAVQVKGTARAFKWVRSRFAKSFVQKLNEEIGQTIANNMRQKLVQFECQVFNQYPRESREPHLTWLLNGMKNRELHVAGFLKNYLSTDECDRIEYALRFHPFDLLEAQKQHEIYQLSKRASFFDKVESNPLTVEQRLAVLRNDDRNMVLAAAGTGKTSVIVAKVLDLIDRNLAKPSRILVLAYNNGAAAEIRKRLKLRAQTSGTNVEDGFEVFTFHALGRQIIRNVGVTTHISDFTDDKTKLNQWVTSWLIEYVKSQPKRMVDLLSLIPEPIDPFSFKTKPEYENFIQKTEYRTLNDEHVKGYQELLIANHLYMNGVEYIYEDPYVSKVRIQPGFDYRPDYYLNDADIYLEHFGISRDGSTRPDIDAEAYNASIDRKIILHEEMGTRLIKTYHYEWKEGTLLSGLNEKLIGEGVELSPISPEDLFKKLNDSGKISEWSKRFLDCLKAIRNERLDKVGLLKRLHDSKILEAELWADVLEDLRVAYVSELKAQDRIDFDDMILKAIEAINSGNFIPNWDYILVDEFQDISEARMDLIRSITSHGVSPSLTVVGDDWQSIYRFAGGKLELTTRFEALVGSRKLSKLQKTFRYNNSIALTAGNFVMENDEQYKKQIETNDIVETSQIYLLDDNVNSSKKGLEKYEGLYNRVVQIVRTIRKNETDASIAIIGRYNKPLNRARAALKIKGFTKGLKFWTYHGSKGLEADYVILISLKQGRLSFPNEQGNDTILEVLLPSLDDFPNSEERRLFYVGLTRAKHKVYIVGDARSPSKFIPELLNPKYEINIESDVFYEAQRKRFKCPTCETGYFQLETGPHSEFYVCSSDLACDRRRTRVCKKCNSPSIDGRYKSVCNNASCRETLPICEKCGRPMKQRKGKNGQFWGCSGYGIKDDQCTYTVNRLPA